MDVSSLLQFLHGFKNGLDETIVITEIQKCSKNSFNNLVARMKHFSHLYMGVSMDLMKHCGEDTSYEIYPCVTQGMLEQNDTFCGTIL